MSSDCKTEFLQRTGRPVQYDSVKLFLVACLVAKTATTVAPRDWWSGFTRHRAAYFQPTARNSPSTDIAELWVQRTRGGWTMPDRATTALDWIPKTISPL